MSPVPNPQVTYAKIPSDYPVPGEHLVYEKDASTIDLDTVPLNGGVLVKTLYISVDPYMRGRMRDPSIQSYSPTFELGQPGNGGIIVKVLRSETSKYAIGDHLLAEYGAWRAYQVLPENVPFTIHKLENPYNLPWSAFLGVAGMPGETAFYSTRTFGDFKQGETIFVSTAAGMVGSVVVQLAKLAGLKVIGSTGDDAKVKYLKELGVDVAFNYKKESVWDVLKENGPIDIYFDNTGGEQLDAALLHAAPQDARFIMCGYISEYNLPKDAEGYRLKYMPQVFAKSISMNGFLVFRLTAKYGREPLIREYLPLLKDKKIKYQEDRTYGLENLAEGLVGVLKGVNKGKGVIVVAEDQDHQA